MVAWARLRHEEVLQEVVDTLATAAELLLPDDWTRACRWLGLAANEPPSSWVESSLAADLSLFEEDIPLHRVPRVPYHDLVGLGVLDGDPQIIAALHSSNFTISRVLEADPRGGLVVFDLMTQQRHWIAVGSTEFVGQVVAFRRVDFAQFSLPACAMVAVSPELVRTVRGIIWRRQQQAMPLAAYVYRQALTGPYGAEHWR